MELRGVAHGGFETPVAGRRNEAVAARIARDLANQTKRVVVTREVAKAALRLLVGCLAALPAAASDHIDGTLTTAQRVGDLADLYAFPTPGRAASLTLILDTYPLAPADARFSKRVGYTFRLRRAALVREHGEARVATSDEVAIDCSFEARLKGGLEVVCRSSNGLTARGRRDAVSASGDFRLYAGMRADPFFLNLDFFSDALDGELGTPDDSNGMAGANVLALALELELGRLWAEPPTLVAVVAEASERGTPGPRRLDRVGRPEITNLALAAGDTADLRDAYNREPSFATATASSGYRARLVRSVAFFDALDGVTDWSERERTALAAVLADDFLVVDVSRPCGPGSFLEVETALLRGRAHRGCGGRRLHEDVMDTLFTLYVSGWSGRRVRDGADRPAAALSEEFPYLSAPDAGLWSALKVYLARKFLGIPDAR